MVGRDGRGRRRTPATAPVAMAAGDLDGDGHTGPGRAPASGALKVLRQPRQHEHRDLRAPRRPGQQPQRRRLQGHGARGQPPPDGSRPPRPRRPSRPPTSSSAWARATAADAVRVLWPSGILQTELPLRGRPAPARTARARHQGAGPQAVVVPVPVRLERARVRVRHRLHGRRRDGRTGTAPGHYNHPDPDEYVRSADDQLRPRDGRLELRVTNELEEALFVDRLCSCSASLIRPTSRSIPNEGMRRAGAALPPRRRARRARPVAAAIDDRGRDVLDRLAARRPPRSWTAFALRHIRGYAEEHALDAGSRPGGRRRRASSCSPAGPTTRSPATTWPRTRPAWPCSRRRLQVQDGSGAWQTVIDGPRHPRRPSADVWSSRWPAAGASDARRVRIVTNMRIYWDRGARSALRATLPGPAASASSRCART